LTLSTSPAPTYREISTAWPVNSDAMKNHDEEDLPADADGGIAGVADEVSDENCDRPALEPAITF